MSVLLVICGSVPIMIAINNTMLTVQSSYKKKKTKTIVSQTIDFPNSLS